LESFHEVSTARESGQVSKVSAKLSAPREGGKLPKTYHGLPPRAKAGLKNNQCKSKSTRVKPAQGSFSYPPTRARFCGSWTKAFVIGGDKVPTRFRAKCADEVFCQAKSKTNENI
jgi:hypothetical protein